MDFSLMQASMKKAVALAKTYEGDWQACMKLAFRSIKVEHYMKEPISKEIIVKLLLHNVSYRRIAKNYDMTRKAVKTFDNI
ncbi:hypothetical protein GCM10008931_41050 [Oceanobacillus oncorhynchi subsp. oncorhynchi]|uniref:hypothetical protein n=1 Tax=Oceanobacillus oncorhynchi TaxID=545501 RepID=UPI0031D609A8